MRKPVFFHGQAGIMMAVYTFIIVIVQDERLIELSMIKKVNVLTVGFL